MSDRRSAAFKAWETRRANQFARKFPREATPVVVELTGTVLRYTTAPEAYDGFGTETVEPDAGRDNRGYPVRLVSIRREHLEWQDGRYGSGTHACVSVEVAGRFPTIWRLHPSTES